MSATLDGRELILGVTGSIAAYKAVHLLRELTRAGARVSVCLSEHAREFVESQRRRIARSHPAAAGDGGGSGGGGGSAADAGGDGYSGGGGPDRSKLADAIIARVRITLGTGALGANVEDISAGGAVDLVVLDNLIYSEPRRIL